MPERSTGCNDRPFKSYIVEQPLDGGMLRVGSA
jgi:hypothetical protein